MLLSDFKAHIAERIEDSIVNAEEQLSRKLPRQLAFRRLSPAGETVTTGIEDEVARLTFVAEDEIWPCVDIGPLQLDDSGRLVIGGLRAGYKPRPFGRNWKGEEGPFILIYFQQLATKVV